MALPQAARRAGWALRVGLAMGLVAGLAAGLAAGLWGCGPAPLATPRAAEAGERPRHRLPVVRLVASADGRALGTADGEALHIWRLPDLALSARVPWEGLDFAQRLVLSPHGQQAAAWGADQQLWAWPDGAGGVYALDPPGRTPQHLIGFDAQGALLWVDTQGEVLRGVDAPTRLGSVRAAPIYVSGEPSRGSLLWGLDPAWLRCAPRAGGAQGAPVCALVKVAPFWGRWQPDAAPAGDMDAAMIWAPRGAEVFPLDLAAGRMGAPMGAPRALPYGRLGAMALSPDARWLVTAAEGARLLWWALPQGEVARVTALPPDLVDPLWPSATLDAAFSDPQTLWVLLPEQRLLRYDAVTGQRTGSWAL